MSTAKIAITIEENLLRRVDQLVSANKYTSRSRAIQEAVAEKLRRMDRTRLAQECAKLEPSAEQALAEEGISEVADEWLAY